MTETLVAFEDVLERYDPALGLEVHVELNTNTKMFCGCPAAFGGEPNTHVCPTCLGLPGSMPVVNRTAVESAIRIGLPSSEMFCDRGSTPSAWHNVANTSPTPTCLSSTVVPSALVRPKAWPPRMPPPASTVDHARG